MVTHLGHGIAAGHVRCRRKLDGARGLPKPPVSKRFALGVTFERFLEEAIAESPTEEAEDDRNDNHEDDTADAFSQS